MLLTKPFTLLALLGDVSLAAPSVSSVDSSYDITSNAVRRLNATGKGWPPEPFRVLLPNYRGGYLVFRGYGSSGSVRDSTVLLALLDMVTKANTLTPAGFPSRCFSMLSILLPCRLVSHKTYLGSQLLNIRV